MQIAEKFKPVIYFHSNEKHMPDTMEAYLENASLLMKGKQKKDGNIIVEKITPELLAVDYKDEVYTIESENIFGNLERACAYVRVENREKEYRIVYFVFFPFNGPLQVLNCIEAGAHRADVEKFTFFVDKQSETIKRVYLSAHGSKDGMWLFPEDFEKEDGRLVIYSALGSHAFYNEAKTYYRYFGVANDHTNKGIRWDPKITILEENGAVPIWQTYTGTLGSPDNCNTPRYRGWEDEPVHSTTKWKRFFGCC